MKTMMAVRAVAAAAVLVVGGATVAWAQETATTFDGFSCAVNFNQFPPANVAPDLRGEVWVTTDTTKQCPGTPESPTVIMRCFGVVEDWEAGFAINTTNFDCRISGAQCGFPGSGLATSRRLTVDGAGNLELRCSANRGAFP